jgi:general secretion pathway protein A
MYEHFFGLSERPFSLLPDPDFLYLSPQHKLARAYLEYGLTQKIGFVVLTGEIGTGKTTLIKSLLKARAGKQRLGVLYQTSFDAGDLLELLLREFEIQGHFPSRTTRLAAFNQFLIQAYGRGEHVVLIVDEAHNLGAAALEELRLLSNIQTDKEPLLQVILVGQPNLRDRLRLPALRQLAQRVGVHFHLQPLDEAESKEYIQYRLARAGGSGIFTPSALEKIFEVTQGVPRRINAWCDLALVAAFAENRQEIDREFLETVVAAQGESLEGPDRTENGSEEELATASNPQEPWVAGDQAAQPSKSQGEQGAGNNLRKEVWELSARVARLEGMVLDLTGQLMPALNKFYSQQPATPSPEAELSLPALPPDGVLEPHPAPPSPRRRRWWSRFFIP